MKMTFRERLADWISGGKITEMYNEANLCLVDRDEWRALCEQSSANSAEYMNKLAHANAHLRNIAEMGTPNMAHIGKKMQAEAIKGLTQPKYTG